MLVLIFFSALLICFTLYDITRNVFEYQLLTPCYSSSYYCVLSIPHHPNSKILGSVTCICYSIKHELPKNIHTLTLFQTQLRSHSHYHLSLNSAFPICFYFIISSSFLLLIFQLFCHYRLYFYSFPLFSSFWHIIYITSWPQAEIYHSGRF